MPTKTISRCGINSLSYQLCSPLLLLFACTVTLLDLTRYRTSTTGRLCMRHLPSSVRESSFVTRLKQKDLIANRENICILSTFSFNLHDFIAIASALLCFRGKARATRVPSQSSSIRLRAKGKDIGSVPADKHRKCAAERGSETWTQINGTSIHGS